MSFLRPIGELFLVLESVLVGCKIVVHGPSDLSFATQAMRLLMFCARYLDLLWIQSNVSVRLSIKLFILFSTLFVVMLLGYKKCSQDAHRNVSDGTIREVTAILSFSAALGATLMYIPTVPEFFWAFSRFIDIVVEIPQLKMVYMSDELDKWIIAYYCCIGSHAFFSTASLIYRIQHEIIFDIITLSTIIFKGTAIAIFFVVRFFNQRDKRPAEGQEGTILDSDAPVSRDANEKSPAIVVVAVV